MQALNVYADQVSKGEVPDIATLEFFVRGREGDSFSKIVASLRDDGSLAPLFLAFGLISPKEAAEYAAATRNSSDGRNLFEWLSGIAAEAALTAEQHDAMKSEIRVARSELEDRFGIAALGMDDAAGSSGEAQIQQLEALATLRSALEELECEQGFEGLFRGLSIRLYHPNTAPLATRGFQSPDGTFNVRSVPMISHVGEAGTVHIVAEAQGLVSALRNLDLDRARLLCKVGSFWTLRSRALAQVLKDELKVENVWFDSKTEAAEQQFVLWAGTLLERRDYLAAVLSGQEFSFSVLVHSEQTSPLLDFVSTSSVLQVRTDCPPKNLLAFMASEAGALAHKTATLVADTRAQEEDALAAVRNALGAKHVVRVCSSYDQVRGTHCIYLFILYYSLLEQRMPHSYLEYQFIVVFYWQDKVLAAAQRLVEAAPYIRASVDLSGVSLAIDDCYDVWDSGFVSIPFDFSLSDIQPQLKALLAAPQNSSRSKPVSRNGTTVTSATAGWGAMPLRWQKLMQPMRLGLARLPLRPAVPRIYF